MISFSNIVAKFTKFAESNKFISSFSYGSPEDVDLDKMEQYPLMHLVYTGSSYGNQTKTYALEVYVLDLPQTKVDKAREQKESISDCEQVAEDILADLEHGGVVFDFEYHYRLASASVQALEEEGSNVLAGVLLSIAIEVPYLYDACNAPLDGVTPGGSATPSTQMGLMRFRTVDSNPDVGSVKQVVVPNGTLTDLGNGVVQLVYSTGGAEGTQKVFQSSVVASPTEAQYEDIAQLGVSANTTLNYAGGAVTGTGTAGVTIDPSGQGVSITGMSTGNQVTVVAEVFVYQDTNIAAQDFVQIFSEQTKSGSSFYADSTSVDGLISVFPQFGYAFAELYTVQYTYTVVTHSAYEVRIKTNSVNGTSKGKMKQLTITIQQ